MFNNVNLESIKQNLKDSGKFTDEEIELLFNVPAKQEKILIDFDLVFHWLNDRSYKSKKIYEVLSEFFEVDLNKEPERIIGGEESNFGLHKIMLRCKEKYQSLESPFSGIMEATSKLQKLYESNNFRILDNALAEAKHELELFVMEICKELYQNWSEVQMKEMKESEVVSKFPEYYEEEELW